MPFPWDAENIVANLTTLSRIVRGDKLAVAGERFEIQKKGFVTSFKRTFSSESVVSYIVPITRIFEHTQPGKRPVPITNRLIKDAYLGLQQLRETYIANREKLLTMDRIIRTVSPFLPHDYGLHGVGDNRYIDLPGGNHAAYRVSLGGMKDDLGHLLVDDTKTNEENTKEADMSNTTGTNVVQGWRGLKLKDAERYLGRGNNTPTTIPTLPNHSNPYQRHAFGVSVQYFKDCVDRDGHLRVDGRPLATGKDNIAQLLQFVRGDLAMMFALSQMANQAAVMGIPSIILSHSSHHNAENRVLKPLFHFGGERIGFMNYKNEDEMDLHRIGEVFIVELRQKLKTGGMLSMTTHMDGTVKEAGEPVVSNGRGILSCTIHLAVGLKRTGASLEIGMETQRSFIELSSNL